MSTTIDVVSIDTIPSPAGTRRYSRTVQVLNASYQPLRPVTVHRAIRLLAADKAVVEQPDPSGRYVLTSNGRAMWPWPAVVRLVRMAKVAYQHVHHRPQRWSKQGVLVRDRHRCAYCHGRGDTIDHVVPRAAGGRSEWLNTVAACQPCNGRKRDHTPAQAGMKLLVTPYVPRRAG